MKRPSERGLGRGLGALIPRPSVGLRDVPVQAVRPNPWQPRHTFETGLRDTVAWYLDNSWWWEPIWSERYRGTRLGTGRSAATTAGAPR